LGAHLPSGLALLLDLLQPPREHAHALRNQAPVGLELSLARPAHADTALLPLEVAPAAHQPAADVPQLRQLDFQLALEAARPLREDVEDQAVAIEHPLTSQSLEVALLARGEGMIHEDHIRPGGLGRPLQLLGLAA